MYERDMKVKRQKRDQQQLMLQRGLLNDISAEFSSQSNQSFGTIFGMSK